MSAAFLKNLPSSSGENFSNFTAEAAKIPMPGAKLHPKDSDSKDCKVIVTEKRSFLLRYLHQRWDKTTKTAAKRSAPSSDEEASPPSHSSAQPSRKMPRTT